MLVKCKKCETKLKISDDKLTEEGIKIKCPKCASVLLIKKPTAAKTPPKEELTPAPPVMAVAPPEPEEEIAPPTAPQIPTPEEDIAPPEEEVALNFGMEEEEPPSFEEETKEPMEGFDASFTLDENLDVGGGGESKEKAPEEEPAAPEEEEAFKLELNSASETESYEPDLGADADEEEEKEEDVEEFQLDSDFDFSEESKPKKDAEVSSDIAGDVGPSDEENEDELAPPEDVISLKEEGAITIDEGRHSKHEEISISGDKTSAPRPEMPPRIKPKKKEATGYGVSSRRSIPIIIPIILVVLIMGAIYVAFTKINTAPKEESGELNLYDYHEDFVNNEKEGKVFIISGKVSNGYQTDRSFIQVKGTLFDKDEKEIASKTVYAGNIPTDLECRKLPIDEIDKILSRKMGEELSNMNVSPGTSIEFKIVFSNVSEDQVAHFKVVGAGSQAAYK